MLYIPFEEILTTLRRALEKAGFEDVYKRQGCILIKYSKCID